MNMNVSKTNTGKLLVAVLAMAMVIAGCAVLFGNSVSAAGDASDPYTLVNGPVEVTGSNGDVIDEITTLEDALGQADYSGQTWTLEAGYYKVTGGTTSNYSALVITQNDLTIKGAGIGQTVIITDKMTGTSVYTPGAAVSANQQATVVIDADGVTVEGMTITNAILSNDSSYKCMEIFGANATVKNVSFDLNPIATEGTATSGVLINNTTDAGTVTISGCTFNNGLINIGYMKGAGSLKVENTTMNVESQGGFGISTYNPNEGSNNDVALDNVQASNLVINVDAAINNAGSLINMSVSGTTVNVNENVTLTNEVVTIESGVNLNIASDKTVTANGDVTLKGRLSGAGQLSVANQKTLTIIPGSSYSPSNIADGTKVTGSTNWEDVVLQGTYDSTLNGKSNQKVTIVDDLTIGANADITIAGQLIVNEGATVTVKSGAQITIESGATVQIDGDVTIEGSTESYATFTFNGKSMNVVGSIILGGANSFSCDNTGEVNITGTFEIGEEASASFGNATIASGGELIVYGLVNGNVKNNGTITIDSLGISGANPSNINGFGIEMGAGATVNIDNIYGYVTISDKDLKCKINGVDVDVKNDNSIMLKHVSGVTVTETLEMKTDKDGNRYGDNTMYITGSITDGTMYEGASKSQASMVQMNGANIVIAENTTFTDVNVEVAGAVKVTADVEFGGEVSYGTTTEDAKISGEGQITVTGKITSEFKIGSKPVVNGVVYETGTGSDKVYIYTTLETAIADGATKITATGEFTVESSVTIPVGTSVDATAAEITVSEDATVTVAAQDRNSGKLTNKSADGIIVDGTLVIENLDRSGITESGIVSDTSSKAGDAATFTNIYNALENAQADETVTITKMGDQTVTLDRNVEVKTGVTLEILSGKTVVVDNGITMTVNGTLYVNSGTLQIEPEVTTEGKEEDAGAVIVNGMLTSVASTDGYQNMIAGAYFGYNNLNVIAPLATAAGLVNDIETSQIVLYLENEVADIAFDYTGSDVITLVNNGILTAGTIDLGVVTFQAAASTDSVPVSTTATLALTNGSVELDNVNSITVTDVVTYDADNNAIYTATISGTSVGALDNKDTTDVVERGTVTTIGAVSTGASYSAVVDIVVPADSTLTATAGPIQNIVVEGTMTATASVTVINATVIGTMNTDDGKITVTKLYAGVYADDIIAEDLGASAVIGDGVVLAAASSKPVAYIAPGCTVTEDIISANGIKTTEYYVQDALYVTAYAMGSTPITDIVAAIEHTEFKGWFNAEKTGKADTSTMVGAVGFDKVYADIDYNIYKIDVSSCPGVSVYIDGKEWKDGTLYAYGAHNIDIYITPGYEGTPAITINGQSVTGNSFELTGDTEITVSGITAVDYSQTGGSDGLGLTEILLIILVVLIVIMAIMVALRLMRS